MSSLPFGDQSTGDLEKLPEEHPLREVFIAFRRSVHWGPLLSATMLGFGLVFIAFRRSVHWGPASTAHKEPLPSRKSSLPFGDQSTGDSRDSWKRFIQVRESSLPFGDQSTGDMRTGRLLQNYHSRLHCLSAISPLGTEKCYT